MLVALVVATPVFAHPDTGDFVQSAFLKAPEIVDCTLEDGTETQCHEITVGYLPDGLKIGPFCPATLDDAGGIWEWTGENAGLYRVDGDFLRMLDGLGYRFFDDDGNVYSVDNATERPTVDHACINVSVDESVEITMLLPVDPVMADTPTQLGTVGKVGVALDGVPIFSDAPSIQMTGHMPALDTCGGHVDPGGWYHWHATSTDIATVFATEHVDADCAIGSEPRRASSAMPSTASRSMAAASRTGRNLWGWINATVMWPRWRTARKPTTTTRAKPSRTCRPVLSACRHKATLPRPRQPGSARKGRARMAATSHPAPKAAAPVACLRALRRPQRRLASSRRHCWTRLEDPASNLTLRLPQQSLA